MALAVSAPPPHAVGWALAFQPPAGDKLMGEPKNNVICLTTHYVAFSELNAIR